MSNTYADNVERHRAWLDRQQPAIRWQRWPAQHTYNVSVANVYTGEVAALMAAIGINGSVTRQLGSWEGEVESGVVITVQCSESTLVRLLRVLTDAYSHEDWFHVHDVDGDRYAYIDVKEF